MEIIEKGKYNKRITYSFSCDSCGCKGYADARDTVEEENYPRQENIGGEIVTVNPIFCPTCLNRLLGINSKSKIGKSIV